MNSDTNCESKKSNDDKSVDIAYEDRSCRYTKIMKKWTNCNVILFLPIIIIGNDIETYDTETIKLYRAQSDNQLKEINVVDIHEYSVERIISLGKFKFETLYWFISKILKYLKPGGQFYFRYATYYSDKIIRVAEEIRSDTKWKCKFQDFKLISPFDYLKSIGFKVEKSKIWKYPKRFSKL